jgi:hypothetical protein
MREMFPEAHIHIRTPAGCLNVTLFLDYPPCAAVPIGMKKYTLCEV